MISEENDVNFIESLRESVKKDLKIAYQTGFVNGTNDTIIKIINILNNHDEKALFSVHNFIRELKDEIDAKL